MNIKRREFLLGAGATALAFASKREAFGAMTELPVPYAKSHVGIIGSDFRGVRGQDGSFITGLAEPRPLNATLTDTQFDDMVRTALGVAGAPRAGLAAIVKPNDWVVIKPNIVLCPGASEVMQADWVPGMVADPRIVRTLVSYLVEHHCGRRITIAEASGGWKCLGHSKDKVDGWTTNWDGAFGQITYRGMVSEFSQRYPKVRFDIVDLNFDDVSELAVPGGALAPSNPTGKYFIPKTVLNSNRLISVAAMKINPVGASLSIKNYFGIGPGSRYGFPKSKLHEFGNPSEVMVDLFSFHPADFAIVGGSFGVEGDNQQNVHHNVIVAGTSAIAVDSVAATVMGFGARDLAFLRNAVKKRLGTLELSEISTHGNTIAEVQRKFALSSEWHPS
jgi:uncharacterized protein (DUF362 family)